MFLSKLSRPDNDKNEAPKTSRYIESLLKTAERRKREHERRHLRKNQRKLEEEKDSFGEVPTFITSTYKDKLKEVKALEEKEKMEIALEEAMDVKKQRDLCGFYKYFLNNELCSEKKKKLTEKEEAEALTSKKEAPTSQPEIEDDKKASQIEGDKDDPPESTVECLVEPEEEKPDPKEQLRLIFEKRTVGEKFLEAVHRFEERRKS